MRLTHSWVTSPWQTETLDWEMKTTPLVDCPHQDCSAVEIMSGFEPTHTLRYVLSVQGTYAKEPGLITCPQVFSDLPSEHRMRWPHQLLQTPHSNQFSCQHHAFHVPVAYNSQHQTITVKYFVLVTASCFVPPIPLSLGSSKSGPCHPSLSLLPLTSLLSPFPSLSLPVAYSIHTNTWG